MWFATISSHKHEPNSYVYVVLKKAFEQAIKNSTMLLSSMTIAHEYQDIQASYPSKPAQDIRKEPNSSAKWKCATENVTLLSLSAK